MGKGLRAVAPNVSPETLEHPRLSELDAAKLETALLRVELLQTHLRQRQAELDALAKGLERPHWILQRMGDGAWVYQPAPPKTTEPT